MRAPLPARGNLHVALALRLGVQPSKTDAELLAELDRQLAGAPRRAAAGPWASDAPTLFEGQEMAS